MKFKLLKRGEDHWRCIGTGPAADIMLLQYKIWLIEAIGKGHFMATDFYCGDRSSLKSNRLVLMAKEDRRDKEIQSSKVNRPKEKES